MAEFAIYAIAVAVTGILALISRDRLAIFGATIIALNWALWSSFIIVTGIYDPWHVGIMLDGLSAAMLLKTPSNRPKSVLAGLYCVQITMHIAYAMVRIMGGDPDYVAYADRLDMVLWLQLLVVAGWSSGNIGGHIVRRWRAHRGAVHQSDTSHLGGGR